MNMRPLVASILLCSTSAVAAPALAQQESAEQAYNFNVKAGRLPDVVAAIAKQARASIDFDQARAPKIKVSGVEGRMTLEQALDRVLQGSGYSVRANGTRAFSIGAASGGEHDTDIVVTAYRRDFVRNSSSLLTRTDTSLRDTPGTIDSVTQEVLQSQNAISINEALKNVPGVVFYQQGTTVVTAINQESVQGSTYSNGLANSSLASNPPTSSVEAIEVLKGPASILTGAQVAGGVINFVPKTADGRSGGYLKAGFGSGGELLGEVDAAGAISRDDGFFWRVSAFVEGADHVPNGISARPQQWSLTPMLGYRADGIVVDLSYEHFSKRSPFAVLAWWNPTTNVFTRWGDLVSPRESYNFVSDNKVRFNVEKRLVSSSDFNLQFRTRGQYDFGNTDGKFVVPSRANLINIYNVFLGASNLYSERQYSLYSDLYARFSTGPIAHQLIVGFDGSWSRSITRQSTVVTLATLTQVVAPPAIPTLADSPSFSRTNQYGIIAQDQMTWGPVHMLAGLRESFYDTSFRSTSGTLTESNLRHFSTNAGLVYDVAKSLALYVSYNNAFTPPTSSARTFAQQALPPQVRTQFEGGVKASLFNDKLTINLSGYDYRQTNTPGPDLNHPGFYTILGDIKGRGVEASVSGSITPTTKVIAGFAHSVAHTVTGISLPQAPENVANAWVLQTIKIAPKQSLDIGVGANYTSGFWAPDVSAQPLLERYLPQNYMQVNASVAYRIGKMTINAVVNNVFNRLNFQPGSVAFLPIDVPRSFRITASWRF